MRTEVFQRVRHDGRSCVRWVTSWTGAALAFALALPAYAQQLPQGFVIPNRPSGLPEGTLPGLIALVIRAALVLVGITALGFIVYGGFRYIISKGDEGEVENAKKTITYAVIGIIVIGLAYAIVEFVVQGVFGVIQTEEPPFAPSRPNGGL